MNNVSINDVQVTTFAQTQNGNILPGYSSHPAAHNIDSRVARLVASVRSGHADGGGSRDMWNKFEHWKAKGYTIWVKASNRDAVQAWPKV